MNCTLARQVMDAYLDHELNPRECRQLEAHLGACPQCAADLHARAAFQHRLRRALAASVQGRGLAPTVGARLVVEVQQGLQRAIWVNHARTVSSRLVSAVSVALVLLGIAFVFHRIPLSPGRPRVTVVPAQRIFPAQQRLANGQASLQAEWEEEAAMLQAEGVPLLTLRPSGTVVAPSPLVAGQPFTITLAIHSDLPFSLQTLRLDLEISGPAGFYQFPLTLQARLPAGGISTVRITTDLLDRPTREMYLIQPTDIFDVPGVYVLRFVLHSPAVKREP